MKIDEPWRILLTPRKGVAIIGADDGCTYEMDADRARRLVALWNANLGIPTSRLRALAAPTDKH